MTFYFIIFMIPTLSKLSTRGKFELLLDFGFLKRHCSLSNTER